MEKGIIKTIENKNRKFGSINEYEAVNLQQGEDISIHLFTKDEISNAKERALKNYEDVAHLDFFDVYSVKYTILFILGFLLGMTICVIF